MAHGAGTWQFKKARPGSAVYGRGVIYPSSEGVTRLHTKVRSWKMARARAKRPKRAEYTPAGGEGTAAERIFNGYPRLWRGRTDKGVSRLLDRADVLLDAVWADAGRVEHRTRLGCHAHRGGGCCIRSVGANARTGIASQWTRGRVLFGTGVKRERLRAPGGWEARERRSKGGPGCGRRFDTFMYATTSEQACVSFARAKEGTRWAAPETGDRDTDDETVSACQPALPPGTALAPNTNSSALFAGPALDFDEKPTTVEPLRTPGAKICSDSRCSAWLDAFGSPVAGLAGRDTQIPAADRRPRGHGLLVYGLELASSP
ncbi:hypothetical protein Purlil1_7524 [Purpureocillium lilacinum]|uniref:Uncharacterized protein n=1 Tax=Purpureocillium lilacinum TaxID=33203 RepID=A0ABR0BVN3_PURLI|nr:hypothetical protein Purlil1_7524 [Purpureocillium lilacinum]